MECLKVSCYPTFYCILRNAEVSLLKVICFSGVFWNQSWPIEQYAVATQTNYWNLFLLLSCSGLLIKYFYNKLSYCQHFSSFKTSIGCWHFGSQLTVGSDLFCCNHVFSTLGWKICLILFCYWKSIGAVVTQIDIDTVPKIHALST